MPITTEKKTVARCDLDKCKAVRYGTDDEPPVGYRAQVEHVIEHDDGVIGHFVEVYACSPAHLSKAIAQQFADPSHVTPRIYSERTAGKDTPE